MKRHWDIISTFIDDDGICIALLKEIVSLWLTIRGFSLCAAFLEDFKKASATKERKPRVCENQLDRRCLFKTIINCVLIIPIKRSGIFRNMHFYCAVLTFYFLLGRLAIGVQSGTSGKALYACCCFHGTFEEQ